MSDNYLTAEGKRLSDKFDRYYKEELECLRREFGDPNYFEGWCIIDTPKYVKTLEDVCGLAIYGEDDAISHLKEFINTEGEDAIYDLGFTGREVLYKLLTYYKLYYWKAISNDGYTEYSDKIFETKSEAYNDMRDAVLEKMKWNTEFDEDLDEYIEYTVCFSKDKITHESYSGLYTYTIEAIE